MTKVHHSQGKVLDAIKEFEAHPSILKIKEHITIDEEFSFVEERKMVSGPDVVIF